MTLHAEMEMPDSQRCPWNLYLISNVKDIVVFLGLKVFISDSSCMFSCSRNQPGGGNVMFACLYKKSVCKKYRTKGVYCRYIQYIRISVFVQPRRVHLFIANCLLKNKFNMHVIYYLCKFKSTLQAKFSCKEYNLIKVYNKLVVIQA